MKNAVKLIEYNIWANQKIMNQAYELTDSAFVQAIGGSFPSVQETLQHLLQSDWIWLHRWKGFPIVDVPKNWDTSTAHSLQSIWQPIQEQTKEEVQTLAEKESLEIAFTSRKGDSFQLPFADSIVHVVNHGTYHRGQVVNMLKILGKEPVSTDYFLFSTQKQ
ncbi:DinB family protein [Marinilongibacter aquaticus]|uniref:DinB family protein n=1 Tax=Marinilongibacter aquaticus TaxID=2975157 RepID=UPI0021BD77C5|nr:DinB family protein [Marinilongibacter aquaticus]UBM59667.1 DinB family protein [Marinilongibacter aquaticus]